MMTALESRILTRFKREVTKRLPVFGVILFGSRARGDADPESDMDVLVILDGPVGPIERECVSDSAWEAGFEQGIVLSPITVSRHEWEEGLLGSSLLAIAVAKEGVTV